jgi:hypothetical protein
MERQIRLAEERGAVSPEVAAGLRAALAAPLATTD